MKKFEFRLKTIAKIRKIEMEEQARKLAVAFQAVRQAKLELAELEKSFYGDLERSKKEVREGLIASPMLLISHHFRFRLKQEAVQKRKEIRELEWKAEQERQKLIEKQKKKKALEKLEQTERERYDDERRRHEIKEMDEVASGRFSFNSD